MTFKCMLCGYIVGDVGEDTLGTRWLREFRIHGARVRITEPGSNTAADPEMEVPIMRQMPQNGRHGFIVHEHCWSLLQSTLQDSDTFRHRLLAICNSIPIPFQLNGIYWEHGYGGLIHCDEKHHYPWEDSLIYNSKVQSVAEMSPYDAYEMSEYFETKLSQDLQVRSSSTDILSRFPQEVIELIVSELHSADVCNMRLVFPSLRPILGDTAFWISRFNPRNDRGFIFEARNSTGLDWVSLYQKSAPSNLPSRLLNRKRVWLLILALAKLADLRLATDSTHLTIPRPDLTWIDVTSNIGDSRMLDEGCRLTGSHTVLIPPDLLSICVSVITIGEVTYITGVCLRSLAGEDVRLGYFSTTAAIECRTSPFKGFVLAVGPRGINALRVVSGEMQQSKWVGNPAKVPTTERLIANEAVNGLRISFDGYKVIGIGLSRIAGSGSQTSSMSMQQMGLWYPTVPKSFINEFSYSGEYPSPDCYRPIICISFGGEKGEHLKYLTQIRCVYAHYICGLEFRYDQNSSSLGVCKLGRYNATGLDVTDFQIDGAGGEIVESVEVEIQRVTDVRAYTFLRHGVLRSIKITTNRQRSCHFGRVISDTSRKKLLTIPNTTITGLYACRHPEFGLISLGVISESIAPKRLF